MFYQFNKRFLSPTRDTESVLKNIHYFDRFNISPRKVIGYLNGEEVDVPCASHQANYWRVCGHYKESGSRFGFEPIKDFKTKPQAELYITELNALLRERLGK